MNMTGDLFSWANGDALRDAGMGLAAEAQEYRAPGWSYRAYQAIVGVARRQSTVHVDDVIRAFPEQPKHFNAWGAVWMRALREGILSKTGQMRETKHRIKHKHQYPVYRSNIY